MEARVANKDLAAHYGCGARRVKLATPAECEACKSALDREIVKQQVTSADTLKLFLSAAGGAAVRFKAL